jgi:HK97 family phage prohead protease
MRELRFTTNKELRVAVDSLTGKRTLAGYAAVFNSPSQDLGGWTETIKPGAFTRSLASNPDVMCLSEHDPKKGLLGRTKSGTLKLAQDEIGLRFECELPDTTLANDTATSIGRGDIDGCSFGFVVVSQTWADSKDGVVRTLNDVDLFDVTVTSMPAYPATSVGLRSAMFPDGVVEVPTEFRSDEELAAMGDECGCDCPECVSGNCLECSDLDCTDENCRCMEGRANKALAELITRKLR